MRRAVSRRTIRRTLCRAGVGLAVATLAGAPWDSRRSAAEASPAAQDEKPPTDAERRDSIRKALTLLSERVPKLRDADGSPRKQFTQATTGLVLLLDGRPLKALDRIEAQPDVTPGGGRRRGGGSATRTVKGAR